jgi:hypothetical protein
MAGSAGEQTLWKLLLYSYHTLIKHLPTFTIYSTPSKVTFEYSSSTVRAGPTHAFLQVKHGAVIIVILNVTSLIVKQLFLQFGYKKPLVLFIYSKFAFSFLVDIR